MNLVADCASILCYDPRKKVIGIAHSGWRGTVERVTENLIRAFADNFHSSPADIVAGIGPSIGPCCYEVGPEVIEKVAMNPGGAGGLITDRTVDGKGHFDLWEANRRQLTGAGVPEGNIEVAGICTRCNPDLYFSYRYHGEKSGRIGAGIMIRSS